jgi:antitoxin component YwqK of YwqJK toxin-antitoxin module
MENNINILEKNFVLKNGVDFDEKLWFTSISDQVIDNPENEGGKPFNGLTYELYPNGNLAYYRYYENGLPHGEFVEFYENGNIKTKQYMRHGQTKGKREKWYENGKLKSVAEYELGICLSYKEWDLNGNLIDEQLEPKEGMKKILEKNRESYKRLYGNEK